MLPLCILSVALAVLPLASSSTLHKRGSKTLTAASSTPPAGFTTVSNVVPLGSGTDNYTYTLHLRTPSLDGLYARMDAISSADGSWLSDADLRPYLAASAEDTTTVVAWLKANGETRYTVSPFGDRISVQSSTASVQKLFNSKLTKYSDNGKRTIARTDAYTIPAEIADAVESVSPLVSFVSAKKRSTAPIKVDPIVPAFHLPSSGQSAVPTNCSLDFITAECLRNLYGTINFKPVASEKTDVMIIGYDDQYFSQADLTNYLKRYRPDAADYAPTVTTYGNVVNDPTNPGGETALDLTMVAAIVPPLKSEFLLVGGLDGDEIIESMQYVLDRPKAARPGVISISYGPDERDVTPAEAAVYEKVSAALAAQGTTVVFASGDNGVDGVQSFEGLLCATNGINPPFPTTPSILLVGSTAGFPQQATDANNDSLGGFWSGAGWSNLYPRPRYQLPDAVFYTASVPRNETQYINATGRVISDVSAYGSNLGVGYLGEFYTIGGTSASSPIFASILALINSFRRQRGRGTIGYVHDRFYRLGGLTGALADVTKGTTCGCGDIPTLCFDCERGFDPATGLGTPNFAGLKKLYGLF